MDEKKYTVEKSTAELYKLRMNRSFGWADITLDVHDRGGRISISSDWGNWANYWGAAGTSFKEFLISLEMGYAASKFQADRWFDHEATIECIREEVNRGRHHADKKVLRKQIRELEDNLNENEFMYEVRQKSELLAYLNYEPEIIRTVSPGFCNFWEKAWPVFVETLKKELNEIPAGK